MIKPKWFVLVACVIFFRARKNIANLEFLLGKRKEKETEGGKWGLIGGTGAFWEGADSPVDFAYREAVYDLNTHLDPAWFQYFTHKVKRDPASLIFEFYFSYEMEPGRWPPVTTNEKAPDDCQWFSMEEIMAMQQRGEVAFNNHEILQEFIETRR